MGSSLVAGIPPTTFFLFSVSLAKELLKNLCWEIITFSFRQLSKEADRCLTLSVPVPESNNDDQMWRYKNLGNSGSNLSLGIPPF